MAHCTLLVGRILAEEGLLAKNIASSHHVSYFLQIAVRQSDHQASVEHEVHVIDVATLLEQHLILVDHENLRAFDDEFVGVVAHFGQNLVVQPDSLQTEYLLMLLFVLACFHEVCDEELHLTFAIV